MDKTLSLYEDRFNHAQYVSMTMEFRCNLKCVHCMIEGTMDRLKPETDEKFDQLMAFNRQSKQWRGLILTGSEITLSKKLPELARKAKASGFEHIRIQTHGMHLAQQSYCQILYTAGVDEYFVSVAGSEASTHDMITVVGGSFDKTVKGLENIDTLENAISITNTVVTKHSYRQLPDLVRRLSHLKKLVQMEFWVYWPMQEDDKKDLMVSHAEILPYLREAIELAFSYGRTVEVKNFPVCMLKEYGHTVVNGQPQLFIDDDFWDEFSKNGFYQCEFREQCKAEDCLGLNSAYVKKYGSDIGLLSPLKT